MSLFGGLCPPFSAASAPVVFENELANFLRTRMGINPYPGKQAQSVVAYPQLKFTVVDGDSFLMLSGASGLGFRHVQFDCRSPVAGEAFLLAERLRLFLTPFTGWMGRVYVKNITRNRPVSGLNPSVNGQDSNSMTRYMAEYSFWFSERIS
jgi:hypothetical protein